MCDPITLTTLAISVASSAAGFVSEMQGAAAQTQYAEQNKVNARVAYEDTTRAINEQQSQALEAAAADKFDTALEARSARATNAVAAGESGISGNTVDGLMRDIYAQQGRYEDRINENTDWSIAQLQQQKRGAGAQMVDRTNAVQPGQKPSFLNLGLKIAAAGIDSYGSYQKSKLPRT